MVTRTKNFNEDIWYRLCKGFAFTDKNKFRGFEIFPQVQ